MFCHFLVVIVQAECAMTRQDGLKLWLGRTISVRNNVNAVKDIVDCTFTKFMA